MSSTQGLDLVQYRKELAQSLLSDLMIILDGQEKLHGRKFVEALVGTYLASLASTLTYNALRELPDGQDEASEALSRRLDAQDFDTLKKLFQSAVSSGIETGFQTARPGTAPKYSVQIQRLEPGKPPRGRNT